MGDSLSGMNYANIRILLLGMPTWCVDVSVIRDSEDQIVPSKSAHPLPTPWEDRDPNLEGNVLDVVFVLKEFANASKGSLELIVELQELNSLNSILFVFISVGYVTM